MDERVAVLSEDERRLLIIDDDQAFSRQLGRSMERAGLQVFAAFNAEEALKMVAEENPNFIVLDMKLENDNGLDLVPDIKEKCPNSKVVMLSGYGNIASAVSAIKNGVADYLAKPAQAEDILNALLSDGEDKPDLPDNILSADRVRWEHIQRVYELCDRNVSETARRLNMHRRTLQRILAKRSPQ